MDIIWRVIKNYLTEFFLDLLINATFEKTRVKKAKKP